MLILPQLAFGQQSPAPLQHFCDSLINVGIEQKLVPGLGLVLIQGESTFSATYGYANIDKKFPVDSTTLFQLGSVGKLFTAIAVLQQVEAGKLNLRAHVNQYLKGFATNPPGRPITLFDLLTHTAGLDDRIIGYLARSEKEVKPLSEHLRERMPPSFQMPGAEINYSNYGYALAGHIVERVTGIDFKEYVKQQIFAPLGMTRTTYFLPDNYQELETYAQGYRIPDEYEEVVCYPRHATPAGSALSCVADMAKLLREFLNPTGKILTDSSMATLMHRQFTSHPLLMGYTLGMEEQHINGYRGVGKGGAFTGFLSEFVTFPEQGFGLFVTTNTQTDNFLELFRAELFNRVLPRRPIAKESEIALDLSEFAQTYRSERYNHRSVEDLLALYQSKFDLTVSKEGDLITYHNGARQHYRPIDSLVFQNTNIPEEYLIFVRDQSGAVSHLYRNVNLAGFYIPVSLTPVPWYDDPVFINEYYFLILIFILTFILVPLFRGLIMLRRRFKPNYMAKLLVSTAYLYPPLMLVMLYTVQIFGGFLFMARKINDFYFGVPDSFVFVQMTTYVIPLVLLLLVLAAWRLWRMKEGRLAFRIYYLLVSGCALVHFVFLYRWHFIGVNV